MKYKRFGLLSLSTALALGIASPTLAADVQAVQEQPSYEVEVAAVDVDIEKEDLIERLNELFPGKFDFLDNRDFHMNNHHIIGWEEEDTIRHSLYFNKQVGGNYIHGNVDFVGEDLTLQSYHYQPEDVKGALYPPEVSQDEAKQLAEDFVSSVADGEYELSDRFEPYVSWGNRTLTEPVRYNFAFQRLENGIPVVGQDLNVTVLGNGEITQYYGGSRHGQDAEYEAQENVLEKDDVLSTIEEKLDVELQYMLYHSPQSMEPEVRLVYVPSPQFGGIHAINGDWELGQSFVSELPETTELTLLSEEERTVEGEPVTRDDVRELAEDLLTVDDGGELRINSIQEQTRNDVDVYVVQYSIQYQNSGYGSSFEVSKETGEIFNFHNASRYDQNVEENLGYEEALEAAVEAIETYAPSKMHEYAYPVNNFNENADRGIYRFSFPQVKDGILVSGSALNVSISAEDGSLDSLYVSPLPEADWPSVDQAVDRETALNDYLNQLDIDLSYGNHPQSDESHKYHLIYRPTFSDGYEYYDATEGEWAKREQDERPDEEPQVSEHWAADELNYMIDAGIISVEDEAEVNPNEVISKGEAIEVIMKSLTRFYPEPPMPDDEVRSTFTNIGPDHELYQVVERAAQQNIIDTDSSTFAVDEALTREELAYWYVRALGLEDAAKHSEIYNVSFADAGAISDEYIGYVALANALGVLQGDSLNQFNAAGEVTLAELAVSNFRLAEKASELGVAVY
ncbi:YcdB/YcdC domain-containing protein [Desertibacillus haloalkaliphilus]|uniref:YcdB/YcdC domain-containing protein n=1 Tax=Desertibacillus haloalkaliphilus TaxID=1328930 RepID=UPI001C25880D|nr:YcdB/YcdC domain-containing protein [Desertibacillus haloalkaliphilus]MBU8905944.1 S-layer homology domain-containing protein [Desertibacillus haloalkaliphilus]